jgi:hypothetical protein
MLTSLLAVTLCLSPSFGDLDGPSSMRAERAMAAPAAKPVAVPLAADSSGFSASPMVTAEGRAATLVTLDQASRLREIDAELKTLAVPPVGFKVLSGIGLVMTGVPLTYASVMAVVFTGAVIADLGVIGVIISPFVFSAGLLVSMPLWGWAIAAGGLVIVGLSHLGASEAVKANAPARDALVAERTTLLDAMKGPSSAIPAIVPLTNIASF